MLKLDFTSPEITKEFQSIEDLIEYIRNNDSSGRLNTHQKIMQWLRNHIPYESWYQKKILDYCKELPIANWTVKISQSSYSKAGIPDIHFESGGRCIHFEVKRPFIGTESQSQKLARQQIIKSGGSSYVVTFVSEVAQILMEEGFISDI